MAEKKKITGPQMAKLEQELYDYKGEDRIVSSHELNKMLEDTESSMFKFNTDIRAMDRILEGVEAGELILVTGPTGEGKTTLLMTITQNLSAAEIPSAWFTLEVTPRQFLQKITKAGGKLPLFYLPAKNEESALEWLEKRIIEAKVKYNVKAIFVDHVHMIFSLHRVRNQSNLSLEIGDMVGKIKDLALTHNLVIFLIAHSRDNSTTPTAEPRKEDIRDSGLIIRQADTVMAIWRVRNDTEITKNKRPSDIGEDDIKSKVRIMKNRRTGKLGAFFLWHEKHGLIEEPIKNYQSKEEF